MSSLSEIMNAAVPVDLASMLPLEAHYEARLDCTVIEQPDGSFALRDGTVTWTVRNSGKLEAEGTLMQDKFGGAGSEALDPETDTVTLTMDASGDEPTYALTISIDHRQPTSGESTWSALKGAFVLNLRLANGVETISGHSFGEEIPAETKVREDERGFFYTHTAPVDQVAYRETYRNLLDAQVLMQYEIFMDCQAIILEPEEDARLTMEACDGCGLSGETLGETVPDVWAESLMWTMPDLGSQAPQYEPESREGAHVGFKYEGPGPESNEDYGKQEVRVSFGGEATACEAPEPQTVRFFFPRDSTNNPDGDKPNWFYYWRQTAAAQGHRNAMQYKASLGAEGIMGYFDPGMPDRINIGPIFEIAGGSTMTSQVTGTSWEGIDAFAAVVLHEWTHLETYKEWWGQKGYRMRVNPQGQVVGEPNDLDQDWVPDELEADMGLDPTKLDTLGIAAIDREYPAFWAMENWASGSVDTHDWADPGKQSGE
jgi:hypothetical protein